VSIAVQDIQRAGMSETVVHVICSRGRNDARASPARASSIRAYAQNIDQHGNRGALRRLRRAPQCHSLADIAGVFFPYMYYCLCCLLI
jgi:hypothetical protein